MTFRGPPKARLIMLAGILSILCPVLPTHPAHAPASPLASSSESLVPQLELAHHDSLPRIEVRLRKLHLVRPDLIPYPIAYEFCC